MWTQSSSACGDGSLYDGDLEMATLPTLPSFPLVLLVCELLLPPNMRRALLQNHYSIGSCVCLSDCFVIVFLQESQSGLSSGDGSSACGDGSLYDGDLEMATLPTLPSFPLVLLVCELLLPPNMRRALLQNHYSIGSCVCLSDCFVIVFLQESQSGLSSGDGRVFHHFLPGENSL